MTRIDIERTASYTKNREQADGRFEGCIRCGKAIRRDGSFVQMSTGWQAISVDEGTPSDSQGMFPIGSECVRHLPAGYAIKVETPRKRSKREEAYRAQFDLDEDEETPEGWANDMRVKGGLR